ncbi:hypothetical protein SAMN05216198_1050 [Halopseudomonas litoralis]|uniref:Uncharacterized protein n=1 Tax=Halopseudomonas litoralis TaxID=797277 RepID=A0A1H1P149_9GAMM|nr:hypothetical protein [Halopseudomonas litoralis]SDS04339.1 hypothetical protein SAMN05216198_1050 [Halopseudomonas litoralis]
MFRSMAEFIFPPELSEDKKNLVRILNEGEVKATGNGTLVRDLKSITDDERFKEISKRYAQLIG